MVDLGIELNLGWLEGVVFGQLNLECEFTALIMSELDDGRQEKTYSIDRAGGARHLGYPIRHVIVNGQFDCRPLHHFAIWIAHIRILL